jgi:hypothetical protein
MKRSLVRAPGAALGGPAEANQDIRLTIQSAVL